MFLIMYAPRMCKPCYHVISIDDDNDDDAHTVIDCLWWCQSISHLVVGTTEQRRDKTVWKHVHKLVYGGLLSIMLRYTHSYHCTYVWHDELIDVNWFLV